MLEKTPSAQRDALLARLSPVGSPRPATSPIQLPSNHWQKPQPAQAQAALSTAVDAPALQSLSPSSHFEAWTSEPAATPAAIQASSAVLEDRSRELELIDDRSLLQALRTADERTVQCALAASSEKFLNRVASKLPRRQASRLREMVRSLGPTRLADLRAAQHHLLSLARGGRTSAESAGR
jgi:hypothetical protein